VAWNTFMSCSLFAAMTSLLQPSWPCAQFAHPSPNSLPLEFLASLSLSLYIYIYIYIILFPVFIFCKSLIVCSQGMGVSRCRQNWQQRTGRALPRHLPRTTLCTQTIWSYHSRLLQFEVNTKTRMPWRKVREFQKMVLASLQRDGIDQTVPGEGL